MENLTIKEHLMIECFLKSIQIHFYINTYYMPLFKTYAGVLYFPIILVKFSLGWYIHGIGIVNVSREIRITRFVVEKH